MALLHTRRNGETGIGQDQKLGIYHKHHDLMDAAFSRARDVRKVMHDEYDDRSQWILDKLSSINERTDGEAKRQQDRMGEFATEYDEGLVSRRKEWSAKLSSEVAEVDRQSSAVAQYITELQRDIAIEAEACRADTASETEPLKEALQFHQEHLEQQVHLREERCSEFRADLRDEFDRLRRRLVDEAEARQQQCSEVSVGVKERLSKLSERLQEEDKKVRTWMLELQTRLQTEHGKRLKAHKSIMDSFTTFVADLEAHLVEGQRSKEVTRATLLRMHGKLRTSDPP